MNAAPQETMSKTEAKAEPAVADVGLKKRQAGPAALAVELRVAIMRTSRRLRNEAASKDISPGHYSVLAAVKPQSMTIGQLAEREKVQAPSMTRIVNALVESGLVTRQTGDKDKRQVVVAITAQGEEQLKQARSKRTQWLAKRVASLSAQDKETLHRAALILTEMSGS